MIFANLDDLLHMNGHGGYVWAAYAVTVMALFWLALAPLMEKRGLLNEIARRRRRDESADDVSEQNSGEN